MTKQPSYRFADYTEPWADKKLGELVERVTRKNKNLESDLLLTISAQYGLIDQETFFNKKVASKDVSGYYLLKKGEFAYNKSYSSDYPWGAVKRLDNYEMGVLSTLYIVFRPNFIDSDFLAVYYDSPKWYKEVSMRAAEGARNHGLLNISPQDFFDTELIFPVNQSEQIAIGSFFQDIDQLISLQQRKLEVLKEQKKTYLKILFPAKGQTKPALRFAGFEDEWKEVKLGEYANYRRGSFPQPYGKKEWYGGEESMPFVQVIDVTDNLALVNDTKQKISKQAQPKSVLVPQGTVIVTLQGSIGRVAITHYDTYVDRTLLIFESYNFPTHIGFWAYTIQNIFEIERQKAPGGTIKTITKEALSSFEISIPSLPEQEAIGSFFQDLDKAIAKQEEKVNQLKESKQILLRKMFI